MCILINLKYRISIIIATTNLFVMMFSNIKRIFSVLSVLLGMAHAGIAQGSVLTTDADFTQMQREAKASKKGFFVVLVAQQDVYFSNELLLAAQTTFRGESKLQNIYQGYVLDGFANIDIAQSYDVKSFPAVLVFNCNGQNIGMNDQISSPGDIWATLSDKKSVATSVTQNNEIAFEDLFYVAKSRGEQEVSINTIKGYDAQSYKKMETRGFGVRVGTYLSLEAFEAEMKQYAAKWSADEIMVYSQVVAGVEAYSIVLGNYTHIEEAKAAQKNIRNLFHNGFSRVVDLSNLKNAVNQ